MADIPVAIAKKALPAILKKAAPGLLKIDPNICATICDAITKCGCRNQIAITEMVAKTVPAFSLYSDSVFSYLTKAMELADKCDTKNYDLIVQAVLDDNLTTMDQKVQYVLYINASQGKLENGRANNFAKKMLAAGTAASMVIVAGGSAGAKIIQEAAKARVPQKSNTIIDTVLGFAKTFRK